ncbi:MAG TPA: hypothetical protein VHY91_12275 [Pirellulales bacterium]|jgi:hypothetical protein|nr:hypothetical protein [Pirellulales bacterium]
MGEITRESIIEAAKVAGLRCGGVLSRSEFERLSGVSQYHLYRAFPGGGWSEVLRLAGLDPHPSNAQPISDHDLLAEFHRVVSEFGKMPTWPQFATKATISKSVIAKRFGSQKDILNAYRSWLGANVADSPMLAAVNERLSHESPKPPADSPIGAEPSKRSAWAKLDGIEYGAPINFRGLRHAPINEQGVVYLFGMVSNELGLIVEAVQTGFPDCEAKRCVNSRENRWQRVRAEFEFRSRNFRDHGHDAAKCDLIVCWKHDWPECPLEVIELRAVINRLDG